MSIGAGRYCQTGRVARVLIDHRMHRGGVGRYGRDLIAGLRDLGRYELEVEGAAAGDGFRTSPFTPWGRRAVGAKARSIGADLIHGLHLELPEAPAIPKVVTIHDVIPMSHPASMPDPGRRWVFRQILARSLRRAAVVIVPSAATAEALADRGADPAKLVVVPNGVGAVFRSLTERERGLARRRFGGGRPYVASITGRAAHKNAGLLQDVASGGLGDVELAVGGDAPPLDRIRRVGRLSDEELRLFYGGAELFLLPSLLEGFGLPVVEALACGTPVVCGSGVGAAVYVNEGVHLVDLTDADMVRAAVLALLGDDARRSSMARSGAEQASLLSVARMASATADVYDSVLGSA